MRAQASRHRSKAFALVKAPRAPIGLVHVEFDDAGGEAFCLIEKCRGEAGAALVRRDAELVEIAVRRIEGDEARRPAGRVEADDDRPAGRPMGP